MGIFSQKNIINGARIKLPPSKRNLWCDVGSANGLIIQGARFTLWMIQTDPLRMTFAVLGKGEKAMTKFKDFLEEQLKDPEVKAAYNAVIKDSGERTAFDTGAVRDMHEGKGRLDLLPCSAILELAKHCENGAIKYGERNVDKGIPQHSFIDSALRHIFKYLRGDKDENHLVAALWNIAWAVNQEVEKPEMQDIPSRMEE